MVCRAGTQRRGRQVPASGRAGRGEPARRPAAVGARRPAGHAPRRPPRPGCL